MALTPEQIREAVEFLPENKQHLYECLQLPAAVPDFVLNMHIAALASALISQVDSMDGHAVHTYPESTQIKRRWSAFVVVDKETDGPNRDENSILACTEFLRKMK